MEKNHPSITLTQKNPNTSEITEKLNKLKNYSKMQIKLILEMSSERPRTVQALQILHL